ncbi:MAG: ATP-binding protein [Woeseia sp.]
MNLRRQLLLVSLLTLVLPWAGCQFVRETESALRQGQQQMLSGTAQAIADSLSQFPGEFLATGGNVAPGNSQLYGHPLGSEPLLDGYVTDWSIDDESMRTMRGVDGPIRYALGVRRQHVWLYIDVPDNQVVYRTGEPPERRASDTVTLVSVGEDDSLTRFVFSAEAPGTIVARRETDAMVRDEQRIAAFWQDRTNGYQLEARVPRQLLGKALGVVVSNTADPLRSGTRSSSFEGARPGRFVTPSPVLASVLAGYVQPGLRLIVTDRQGWRLAKAGSVVGGGQGGSPGASGWLRIAYGAILAPSETAALAEPDVSGREQQDYIVSALDGTTAGSWFRSEQTGRGVVAVAQPVWSGNVQTGAVILQQGTDAILSLTNQALARLLAFTLIATLLVAAILLGYASWMSHRIRRLSSSAQRALDDEHVQTDLPGSHARDEIGDLSRSFSSVLRQLGNYNEYLRSLASRLSHELRTPLTIVRSSLENLDHEPLSEEGMRYAERARDGVRRLQKILNAMSEASRVEEMIGNAEPERFDLVRVLESTVAAYADAWPERRFTFQTALRQAPVHGSPELVTQMLDKLVDNAVDFSTAGDEICITIDENDQHCIVTVDNPGPPLPEKMRSQLFDSMISVRPGGADEHLGLGLFIARLIAEGHDGSIRAENTDNGVRFSACLRRANDTQRAA